MRFQKTQKHTDPGSGSWNTDFRKPRQKMCYWTWMKQDSGWSASRAYENQGFWWLLMEGSGSAITDPDADLGGPKTYSGPVQIRMWIQETQKHTYETGSRCVQYRYTDQQALTKLCLWTWMKQDSGWSASRAYWISSSSRSWARILPATCNTQVYFTSISNSVVYVYLQDKIRLQ